MTLNHNTSILRRSVLMVLGLSGAATVPEDAGAVDGAALEEIVVTAQKREQSMQDVPVAVTSLGEEAVKVNRITDVYDIGSIVPNLTVTEVAGGVGTANFAMRGIVAQGQVAGQDKSVGVYIDGVQNAAPWGSVFDMPVISRIEVLRGPQGTLFGRNSTAGAVSFFTPDPSGEFSFHQQLTVGNFDQFRSNTAVNLPAFGPFSVLIAYDHDERTGDLKNLGAGQVWDRTAGGAGVATSPKTLGDKNSDAVFVAVKVEPSDSLRAVYKFDYLENDFTPNGMALTSLDGSIVPNMVDEGDVVVAGDRRPGSVNNSWIIPGYQEVQGHNLTIDWHISDSFSLKSITGYRETFFLSGSQYDGYGGFTVGGQPFGLMASVLEGASDQWSEEIQAVYGSDRLTLTAGAVYYDVNATNSGPNGGRLLRSAPAFGVVPGGVFVPPTDAEYVDRQETNNKSTAAYLQTEWHVTPQLDLVAGYRWTEDDKSGTTYWTPSSPVPRVTRVATTPYKDAESTYMLGVNYKPSEDMLLYTKFSTGFVSGGVFADLTYQPEKVEAWDAGLKVDLFDRRLRTNLALFYAEYTDLQKVALGTALPEPRFDLSQIITNEGDVTAQGVEAEVAAVVTDKLRIQGSVGYTDYTLKNVNTLLYNPATQTYHLAFRPSTTADLSVRYESDPLFGSARLMANLQANWHDKVNMQPRLPIPEGHEPMRYTPARWIVNARAALTDIEVAHGSLEVALWAKNLLDEDSIMWTSSVAVIDASASYEFARTWGIDLTFNY